MSSMRMRKAKWAKDFTVTIGKLFAMRSSVREWCVQHASGHEEE